MSEQSGEKDWLEVQRIEIITYLTPEGNEVDSCSAEDTDGNMPALKQVLGSLRMAEDTFLQMYGEVGG